MDSSSGVKEKPGNAFNNLSFSNQVLLCATLALSFVSNGFLPVKNAFIFSSLQAMPLKKVLPVLKVFFCQIHLQLYPVIF